MTAQPYNACFTENAVRGCVPFTIRLSDCSGTNNNPSVQQPQYNFGVNSVFTNDSVFTYTSPGTYTITQRVDNGLTGFDIVVKTDLVTVVASPNPVYSILNCIGNQLSIQLLNTTYDYYVIHWGDGSPTSTSPGNSTVPHLYSSSGSYAVTIQGGFNVGGICATTSQTVEVYTTLSIPEIRDLRVLTQTASGSTLLRYAHRKDLQYEIQVSVNNGAYTPLHSYRSSSTDTTSYIHTSINTASNIYCYRIVERDDCSNQQLSEDICSIIASGSALNQSNSLTWSDYTTNGTDFDYYTIERNNSTLVPNQNTNTYLDGAVVCGSNYCYTILSTLQTLGPLGVPHKSYSAPFCLTSISTSIPPAVTQVQASFNPNNTVLVSWTLSPPISTRIQKSIQNSTYTTIGNSSTNSYIDASWTIGQLPCYRVDYQDACGNSAPASVSVCPVELLLTESATDITLQWNPYTGFNGSGIQGYVVEKLDGFGSVIQSIPVGLSFSYTEPIDPTGPDLRFRIRVIPVDNNFTFSFSNIQTVSFQGNIAAPTIFTPNQDGVNDQFIIKGKFIQEFNLYIFNRWGEAIFFTSTWGDGWNGEINNATAPSGVYTWKVVAKDTAGREIIKTGTITLER